jgi:hypothetical protein
MAQVCSEQPFVSVYRAYFVRIYNILCDSVKCSTLYKAMITNKQTNSVAWVRERTIPTERPPLIGEVSADICGSSVSHGQRDGSLGSIFNFLDRSHYYFFQAAPQLYSRGWVDSVPEQLLLGNSCSAGKRTRDLWICSQELWPLDHRGRQSF